MISVKCEKPLHELTLVTIYVSLLYDHQNFKYYTFCVSESTLPCTNRQCLVDVFHFILISLGANTIYRYGKFMNDDHNLRHLVVDN